MWFVHLCLWQLWATPTVAKVATPLKTEETRRRCKKNTRILVMQCTCGSSRETGIAFARMALYCVGKTWAKLVILMLGCAAFLSAPPRHARWKQKKRSKTCKVRTFGLLYLALITCVPMLPVGDVVYENMHLTKTAPVDSSHALCYAESPWQAYN